MLPFFLQYYSQFVDEILIYDGGSTDKSIEIISKFLKAKVYSTGENDQINDHFLINVRNNAYKEEKDNWDWQIIVDTDEFLYYPNLVEKLEEYKHNGITVPLTIGYDMKSLYFPEYDLNKTIIEQIKTGIRNDRWQAKKVISNSKEVNVNYHIGCHNSDFSGNVVHSIPELMVLHYRWLSYDYFINKNKYISNRLSDYNKEHGFGWHTSVWAAMSEIEFNKNIDDTLECI
jgi:glycosyltransferase involved in cell wall biosynthesis